MIYDPAKRFQKDLCTGCGICSTVCPQSAIITDSNGIVTSFRKCINCGHCGCYCPQNCFNLKSVADYSLPAADIIQHLFERRRSVRVFKDKLISDTILQSLLEPIGCAPTGRNAQGLTVEVLADRDVIRKTIVKPLIKAIQVIDSVGLISLFAGSERHLIRKLKNNIDLITCNAPCVLLFKAPISNPTGKTDSIIAATMVSIKAESLGLGVFWNGIVQLSSMFLSIGRKHAVLCIGYPALKQYQMAPLRQWKRF